MTFVIQMFDCDTTFRALFEVVVPIHVLLQVNFAFELFGAHITRLFILHMIVLDVVQVVSFGPFPTTYIADFLLSILCLLELWIMLEPLMRS